MVRYVWLNISTGEFSNSWSEKEHIIAEMDEDELKDAAKRGWKLIKYECPNDETFVFNRLMRVR